MNGAWRGFLRTTEQGRYGPRTGWSERGGIRAHCCVTAVRRDWSGIIRKTVVEWEAWSAATPNATDAVLLPPRGYDVCHEPPAGASRVGFHPQQSRSHTRAAAVIFSSALAR
jgi:hypothetical protein